MGKREPCHYHMRATCKKIDMILRGSFSVGENVPGSNCRLSEIVNLAAALASCIKTTNHGTRNFACLNHTLMYLYLAASLTDGSSLTAFKSSPAFPLSNLCRKF
jgi:hypothetical protein